MQYHHEEIEKKWQQYWETEQSFAADNNSEKLPFYVLDMFPYPSGAGLHVGHPLGYIASDIYSRYKRHKGFNVLHPIGFDAFGLPAEQYAIETGQHPAKTTQANIARYKDQMNLLGFSFDWSREFQTCDPSYYKWTQWIFKQLFMSWYNKDIDKAESIDSLVAHFEAKGTALLNAAQTEELSFTAADWKGYSEEEKADILLNYRLAFRSESMVNWCPELGTVLANDEVKDGLSERGGYPVVQKKMMQWSLRISAYSQKLLDGLEEIDWSESLKESQRNWIGKSTGAQVFFDIKGSDKKLEVFTTRPDTLFGATYMCLAPEHEWVDELCSAEQRSKVAAYVERSAKRSERERMADTKTISGEFLGAYAVHPFTGEEIPIWIGDYVLAGYGTGAVMAVPAHDSRDYAFAKHFGLEIKQVVAGGNIEEESYDAKEGELMNSDFLNGMQVPAAISRMAEALAEKNRGQAKVNYRLRDAVFGRQRYWGEPIPVYYENGVAKLVKDEHLPLELPEIDKYLPTEDGDPPLARAKKWDYHPDKGLVESGTGFPLEQTTMPGWAGSSWYYLRYMDPNNEDVFVDEKAEKYWGSIDLYIGGSEHATGHLLYSRFWHKFLHDIKQVSTTEPFAKLINQGMIQGLSSFAYRVKGENTFVSAGLKNHYDCSPIHVDVSMVQNQQLDTEAFKQWRSDFNDAKFILEDGKFMCSSEVEKMSKSKYNVVVPDDIVAQYGADTLRMYEMFLGPLEQAKPWNTDGISGVHSFLKKLWRMFHQESEWNISEEPASKEEMKAVHTLIKKVNEDLESFSFNTSISAFMICVNQLTSLKSNKREVLEPLAVCLSPFAPHIAEELWSGLGHEGISEVSFPEHEEKYLIEDSHSYPISFNGKMRFKLDFPLDMSKDEIEKEVLAHENAQKYLEGKTPKKVIVVPKKIVNIVL